MPSCTRLLIANRGEIAVRIARSAPISASPFAAVYAEDDAAASPPLAGRRGHPLRGAGPAAYLDAAQLVAAARAAGW
ncbi:MAG: biotin carboxylase N-terminal domain-containing protein [Candidatus Binatia bacterium]